jgi:F-type H+-transporting ATPase subunit a
MEELGKIYQLIIPLFGHNMVFNLNVMVYTLIVMSLLLLFGFLSTRNRGLIPGSMQVVGELFVSKLYELTEDALGREMAKTYAPLICTLFMFLVLSNWIGIIPHLEEPTKDLNTPLSLGILGFVIAHYVGIKTKGFKNYVSEYFQPLFIMMPVVSHLTYSIVLPPVLNAFFGLFVGAIQAFVFTMLTVVYISVQAK